MTHEINDAPIYKYLHRRDVHFWTDEQTVRIASQGHYRRAYEAMEVKSEWINDPSEGMVYRPQTKPIIGRAETNGERRMLRMMGFNPDNVGQTFFSNNLIISFMKPFHMLCFTALSPDEIGDVFGARMDALGYEAYDACIKIPSVRALADTLAGDDTSLSDGLFPGVVFANIHADRVRYKNTNAGWHEDGVDEANPWVKHTDFVDQQEVRLVFEHRESLPGQLRDELFIHSPKLRDVVEVMEIGS